MFPKIGRSETLRNEVVEHIKGLIKKGQLSSGDRLPTEREMAIEFGVSRTVIRDAVKTLAGVGILEVKHGIGIFIGKVDNNTIARQLSSLLMRESDSIVNLFEVRMVLETAAAGWAAERCTVDGRSRIKDFMAESEKLLAKKTDVEGYFLNDQAFHLLVCEISENPVTIRLMKSMLDLLDETRKHTIEIPGRSGLSVKEHAKILEAILEGNVEGAKLSMHSHLASVLQSIRMTLLFRQSEDKNLL